MTDLFNALHPAAAGIDLNEMSGVERAASQILDQLLGGTRFEYVVETWCSDGDVEAIITHPKMPTQQGVRMQLAIDTPDEILLAVARALVALDTTPIYPPTS